MGKLRGIDIRRTRSLAMLLAMLVLLGACGSADNDEAASESADTTFLEAEQAEDASSDDFDLASDDAEVDTEAPAADVAESVNQNTGQLGTTGFQNDEEANEALETGRDIIFTADVTVEVDDIAAASAEATAAVESLDGFLFGQESVGGPDSQSVLVFKVLPKDFQRALQKLDGLGELRNQTVSAEDVTGPIVNLQSEIEVTELGVARLRAALEATETFEEFARVETELLQRETELAILRGQLRTLQKQVDLATITVRLVQDRLVNAISVVVTTYEGHDGGASCPGQVDQRSEADTPVTVCFDVKNDGDQTLTDVTIADTVLGIDAETNLIEVFDQLDELAPGQSTIAAFEIVPPRFQELRTRVSGVPTNGVSPDPTAPAVSSTSNTRLNVYEVETPPGFGDGFSAGKSIVGKVWTAAQVLFGFLLPMLVLAPFIWLAWRGARLLSARRQARRKPKREALKLPSNNPAPVPAYAGAQPPPPSPSDAAPTGEDNPST